MTSPKTRTKAAATKKPAKPGKSKPIALDPVAGAVSAMFESMAIQVAISNSTTRTEVHKDSSVEVVEFQDRGLVLQLPARSCAKGHTLILKLSVAGKGRKSGEDWVFESTAKVDRLASLEGAVDQVTVTLVQYDEKEWMKLQSLYSSRQEEIENFLQSARGW